VAHTIVLHVPSWLIHPGMIPVYYVLLVWSVFGTYLRLTGINKSESAGVLLFFSPVICPIVYSIITSYNVLRLIVYTFAGIKSKRLAPPWVEDWFPSGSCPDW
jgi:hypothetical protein